MLGHMRTIGQNCLMHLHAIVTITKQNVSDVSESNAYRALCKAVKARLQHIKNSDITSKYPKLESYSS